MLVLSRKKNEVIVIRDDIRIVVVDVKGDKVRLGIEAPRDISVHRSEVYDAIHRAVQSLCSHEFPLGACPHQDCPHASAVSQKADGAAD